MVRALTAFALVSLAAGQNISEICIRNEAGFAVEISMTNDKGGKPTMLPNMYSAGFTRCLRGYNLQPGAADGDEVACLTHAVAGKTQPCANGLKHTYQHDAATRAMYTCTGATFTYNCKLSYYQLLEPQCTVSDRDSYFKHLVTPFQDDMKACGLKCLGTHSCVANCMSEKEGYTPTCSSCMGDLQSCTMYSCPVCEINQGDDCVQCQVRNCVTLFNDCTGFAGPESRLKTDVLV